MARVRFTTLDDGDFRVERVAPLECRRRARAVVLATRGACTARHPEQRWSHGARGQVGRQAVALWLEPS